MKYLKLYENFNNTKKILIEYFVKAKMNDNANSYQIGDSNNIKEKIKKLEKHDDFPKEIYNYEVRFYTENTELISECYDKMTQIIEEGYGDAVEVKKIENSNIHMRYKKELRPNYAVIRFTVEKTPDDYNKDWPEEEEEVPEVHEVDPKGLLEYILYYIDDILNPYVSENTLNSELPNQ